MPLLDALQALLVEQKEKLLPKHPLAHLPDTPLCQLDAWLPDAWKQRSASPSSNWAPTQS
ncbi:MAG: hypothetical protein IPM18_13855 [Phycisphaerales bacterium]|nr:hypothetical protein [Phycisphaerales bacterium]